MRTISTLADITSVNQYLGRIGAEVRSLRKAVVKEINGNYWRDVAVIRFDVNGKVKAEVEYLPTDQEQIRIEDEFKQVKFPTIRLSKNIDNPPKEISDAAPEDMFEFRNAVGELLMVQVKIEVKGEKHYIPLTQWDDGEWRKCEPDGLLPLWGMDRLGDNTTVFIHEGAKAAKTMSDMVTAATADQKKKLQGHPWGHELSSAAHIGWIGGALSPSRTDWNELKRKGVKRAYIVSDNDSPGLAAVPHIAYHLQMPTFHIQFTHEWPAGFDLADEFPAKMFSELDGLQRYVGPTFRHCLHPATWATDLQKNQKGKPTPILRDHFKDLWAYVEEADMFICTEMPEILRPEPVLNKMLSSFSHTNTTARLIVQAYRGRQTRLCYRPDHPGRIVTHRNSSAINLHTPTDVKFQPGDPSPWLEFLEYMFPDKDERTEVERWCATLIARPDIRMEYGMLLVSEATGIGKTTLASNILAPLVGVQNVGWPTENDISESSFNEWVANKRLVVVNEIYSGHSWKAYNRLKTMITDRELTVNQKYQRPYTIDNWAHILASSNSLRALRMESDDRRWFYPEVTELRWPREKFGQFRGWCESGGLGIIRRWASTYQNYVDHGDRSPMTKRKADLIVNSRSEGQSEAAELAEALLHSEDPSCFTTKEVVAWVRSQVQGKVFDTDHELRKAMTDVGAFVWPERIKIHGRMQYVVCNSSLWDAAKRAGGRLEQNCAVREGVKRPGDILEGSM